MGTLTTVLPYFSYNSNLLPIYIYNVTLEDTNTMLRKLFFWNSEVKESFDSNPIKQRLNSSVVSELCKSIPSSPYSNFSIADTDYTDVKFLPSSINPSNDKSVMPANENVSSDNQNDNIEDLKKKLAECREELREANEKMKALEIKMSEELRKTEERLEQKEQTLNKLQESIGKKMMTEQRWRKKIDEYVEEIKKLKEEVARLNEENDQLDADIKIGLQAEDDLQEKIDELEIKLMRSNAVKGELEKQIEDQNKLF